MKNGLMAFAAGGCAVAVVAGGLWACQQAQELAWDWGVSRPEVAAWAVRSAGIAVIAAGQVILILGVSGRIYRRGTIDALVGMTSAAVFALACVSAIACGLASR